jgi:hypothetical protein
MDFAALWRGGFSPKPGDLCRVPPSKEVDT